MAQDNHTVFMCNKAWSDLNGNLWQKDTIKLINMRTNRGFRGCELYLMACTYPAVGGLLLQHWAVLHKVPCLGVSQDSYLVYLNKPIQCLKYQETTMSTRKCVLSCFVSQPSSSVRGLAASWTIFGQTVLSPVALSTSSVDKPIYDFTFSCYAVRGMTYDCLVPYSNYISITLDKLDNQIRWFSSDIVRSINLFTYLLTLTYYSYYAVLTQTAFLFCLLLL